MLLLDYRSLNLALRREERTDVLLAVLYFVAEGDCLFYASNCRFGYCERRTDSYWVHTFFALDFWVNLLNLCISLIFNF